MNKHLIETKDVVKNTWIAYYKMRFFPQKHICISPGEFIETNVDTHTLKTLQTKIKTLEFKINILFDTVKLLNGGQLTYKFRDDNKA